MAAREPENARDQQGRWRHGQSGNALGRPVGARNRATVACEVLLDGEAEAITRKAIELAKAGDPTAIRLCLERILPARKGRPVALGMPVINEVADIPPAVGAVLAAVADGDLTPEEGSAVASVIEHLRRAHDLVELEARVRAIEARQQ